MPLSCCVAWSRSFPGSRRRGQQPTKGPPKVVHFSVELHEPLVQMPTPPARFHPGDPVFSALGCKHLAEPMPPISQSVIADFDAAFMQQILDIAK